MARPFADRRVVRYILAVPRENGAMVIQIRNGDHVAWLELSEGQRLKLAQALLDGHEFELDSQKGAFL